MTPQRVWVERLRMLLLVGILAPAFMAALGFFLAYILRGEMIHLSRWPAPIALGAGAVAALASMGLISGLYGIDKRLERALKQTGTRVGLEALRTAGYPVMIVLVCTAGIGEEILFRGGLQPTVGIVAAALLFGISHGGWQREMIPYALAAAMSGAMFGILYRWTGDLWAPITAHAVHNLLSTLLLGKTLDWSWKGLIPVVRLVPDPLEDEEEPAAVQPEGAAGAEYKATVPEPEESVPEPEESATEGSTDERVAESIPTETDGEAVGPDAGNAPARIPE